MQEQRLVGLENMIYIVRGTRIMLDSDLSRLYGVELKRLNEQVKRNIERFPDDFMFQLTSEEHDVLRSQFATFKDSVGKRKYKPYVFSENGVAMLSSVLNSPEAIQVNIAIMRIFTKLRSFLLLEQEMIHKINNIEIGTTKMFRVVFERLDNLEEQLPSHSPDRKKIGLKRNKDS